VNKLPNTSIQANIGIDGLGQRSVQVYQFNGEQTAIQRLADAQTTDQGLAYSIAPYAATLFVIRP
jgi:hypothetical protein